MNTFEILELEHVTSTQKLILLVLKEVDSHDIGISLSDIAYLSSLSKKTVSTNIKSLEQLELIKVLRDGTQTNRYIFNH